MNLYLTLSIFISEKDSIFCTFLLLYPKCNKLRHFLKFITFFFCMRCAVRFRLFIFHSQINSRIESMLQILNLRLFYCKMYLFIHFSNNLLPHYRLNFILFEIVYILFLIILHTRDSIF